MNRIDRLNAIMIQLQSKPKVPLHEIESRFDLSRRTAFRDIRALIDAGVPIGGDAGEGYFIVEGYHLPPVVFNKEEATAILMGAKFVQQNADSETNHQFQEAMTKVRAVLRFADKEYLENLDKSVSVLPSPRNIQKGFPDSHLSTIQYAIASQRAIDIDYHSNYKDQTTSREVNPLGIVFYSSRWHLIGYCKMREGLRDFRTDRITRIKITPSTFDPEQYPDYLHFIENMLRGTDALEATVLFKKEVARFVKDQRFNYGFVEQKELSDGIQMTFYTPSYEYFGRWLLMFTNDVKIISPKELKDMMKDLSKSLKEHH